MSDGSMDEYAIDIQLAGKMMKRIHPARGENDESNVFKI